MTKRINYLYYVLADIQDKAKNADEDKASLITSTRLLVYMYKDVEHQPLNDNYPTEDKIDVKEAEECLRCQQLGMPLIDKTDTLHS